MVAEIAALDLWTLLVGYVFGNFWITVIAMALVLFIIMGVLGRISIYSTMWYCIMFFTCMTLGYGIVILNMLVTMALLVAAFFSFWRYMG
jgi:hypothetical protein